MIHLESRYTGIDRSSCPCFCFTLLLFLSVSDDNIVTVKSPKNVAVGLYFAPTFASLLVVKKQDGDDPKNLVGYGLNAVSMLLKTVVHQPTD